jgi:hypothetical protein
MLDGITLGDITTNLIASVLYTAISFLCGIVWVRLRGTKEKERELAMLISGQQDMKQQFAAYERAMQIREEDRLALDREKEATRVRIDAVQRRLDEEKEARIAAFQTISQLHQQVTHLENENEKQRIQLRYLRQHWLLDEAPYEEMLNWSKEEIMRFWRQMGEVVPEGIEELPKDLIIEELLLQISRRRQAQNRPVLAPSPLPLPAKETQQYHQEDAIQRTPHHPVNLSKPPQERQKRSVGCYVVATMYLIGLISVLFLVNSVW